MAIGITLSLLLPYPELQDAATTRLATAGSEVKLAESSALLFVLVSKSLLPALTKAPCFPALCKQLLQPAPEGDSLAQMLLPASLAQLVLSGNTVSISLGSTSQASQSLSRIPKLRVVIAESSFVLQSAWSEESKCSEMSQSSHL